MKHNGWDDALKVTAGGKGLVGHAGAILLRKAADQAGLTDGLSCALKEKRTSPLLDRGIAIVSMAAAIALGATSMSDIALLAHLAPLFGAAPSGPTVRRALDLAGSPRMLDRIARARAKARAHAWALIAAAATGFPWLAVAGKVLDGWVVIDMDATLVTAHSAKEGAAPTWKKGYGFHPLGAWCRNTRECLAMLLRPGNAGSNTFTDHKEILAAALRQVPSRFRRKILVRVDGAGASHDLIKHLLSLNTKRKKVLFTTGWMITAADEDAIAMVPAGVWKPGTCQDGTAEEDKDVAEITHLLTRAENWPDGLRFIVRRVKPSRRQMKNLTAFEKKTGWRYSVICTNIPDSGIEGVPGSHHPQFTDVLHREHACVETAGVRTAKAMGLRNLPSKTWQVNAGWVIAANIAADLAAWTRLLGHHDEELRAANPDTLRYRIWHLPARLVRHARQRTLNISGDWPWAQAFLDCWHRLCALPAPA
ncbi:IS1380 family transposase [Trebonia sp.]|uniref:IS1380 family transposase n=1 Tax=Trebonia sp. TaxID=2767075 RepID=UPI0026302B2A|nr:IS1380 family transposase [Trebonia sp.]